MAVHDRTPQTRSAAQAVAWLRSPAAIRERCERVYAAAEADALRHLRFHPDRLDACTDYVLDTIRENYPTLDIPYHSRWRHFAVGGHDRWARLAGRIPDTRERGRVQVELAVLSVLLDAGAGHRWRYREPDTGDLYRRSEGLAVASFDLYRSGVFSNREEAPFRADADALAGFGEALLARGFQVDADNPLLGLNGRVALLRRLGVTLRERPDLFGGDGDEPLRLGHLFDRLRERAGAGGRLPAAAILELVLDGLGPIWPGRLELAGVNLGDVWPHPAAALADGSPGDGLVPFHKLSQWLSYSLIEPLQDAGVTIVEPDALTGLPEYRNGGLLIDLGVLTPKDPALLDAPLDAGAEPIVEWRALTVCLLDRLAQRLRARLALDAGQFPLAKALEGGTWAAGRRAAAERRGGLPPITLNSDGTVF